MIVLKDPKHLIIFSKVECVDSGHSSIIEWQSRNWVSLISCNLGEIINNVFGSIIIVLTYWQVHQIISTSKVFGSSSVKFTWTLFVLRLIQIQSTSNK